MKKRIIFCYIWAVIGSVIESFLFLKGYLSLVLYIQAIVFTMIIVFVVYSLHKAVENDSKK